MDGCRRVTMMPLVIKKKLAVTWLDYSPGLGHEKTKEGYYIFTPAGDS